MFKSFAAAALAALSIVSFTPAAEADTRFNLYVGGGGYGYGDGYGDDCRWVGHRYRCATWPFITPFVDGMPVYRPHYRRHHHGDVFYSRMSCGTAVELLQDRGFYRINVKDCRGSNYGFKAKRHGKRYYVKLNSVTGRMSATRI